MKKLLFITLISLFALATGEVSAKKVKLTNPSEKTVTFDSQPQGARVIVGGKTIGITPLTTSIFVPPLLNVTLYDMNNRGRIIYLSQDEIESRFRNNHRIEVKFVKDGYETGVEYIYPKRIYNKNYEQNQQLLWSDGVFHEFTVAEGQSANVYETDPSIPAGEANKVVSRDNPGQTALERTVIRWYFESEPQGARIFWRVISSIPDQVKNTNELWLGSTPFEETRSFNIQGLTYENSRDVQIEIKVRRNGYIDQTKRFNVRQAIDQQEISSFFDMIKAE